MDALEAIITRRSIREFAPQPIPAELLAEIMAAAMQAPSAGNQQPWHFILLTDRKELDALAEVLPYGQPLRSAPLGVAICADLRQLRFSGYWVQDCSAATENLLLAAHARGLGAVWLGVYPDEDRVTNVTRLLALPERVVPLCLVSMGYPAQPQEAPLKRFSEDRLHYHRW